MERLRENRLLIYAICASSAVVVCLAFGISTEISNVFQIVEFPEEVKKNVQSH